MRPASSRRGCTGATPKSPDEGSSAPFAGWDAQAEYESSADIEARFAAAKKDPEFVAALDANFSHVVDGESRDYVLSEVVE